MSAENGAVDVERVDERLDVGGYSREAVVVRPVAEAVAALIDGDDAMAFRQAGRDKVPDARTGGEAVQEQDRRAVPAPVQEVQAERGAVRRPAGQVDEPRCRFYIAFNSWTIWFSASWVSGPRAPKPKSSVVTTPP